MKIIIAGGRDYIPTHWDKFAVELLLRNNECTEVVSGGCSGADFFGEEISNKLGIKKTRFIPEWNRFGKKAGPIRNEKMAIYADAVILLKGGIGTLSMKNMAIKHGIKILRDDNA